MIEGIEELGAEFERSVLTNWKSLDDGEIPIILSGPGENAYSRIAEADAIRIIGAEDGGVGEASLIDISFCAANVRCGRAWIYVLPGGARAGNDCM